MSIFMRIALFLTFFLLQTCLWADQYFAVCPEGFCAERKSINLFVVKQTDPQAKYVLSKVDFKIQKLKSYSFVYFSDKSQPLKVYLATDNQELFELEIRNINQREDLIMKINLIVFIPILPIGKI